MRKIQEEEDLQMLVMKNLEQNLKDFKVKLGKQEGIPEYISKLYLKKMKVQKIK